jgi:rubredoxin
VTEFLANSISTIVKRSVTKADASKKAKHRRAIAPTKEDLAQLVYGNGASKKWDEAPTSWSCPICERTKLEIVRRSKAKKWFAGIYEHVEWYGTDSGDVPHIDRHHWIDVCADCSEVFSELSRKKPVLRDSFLTTEQIKLVIKEHAPHHGLADITEYDALSAERAVWAKATVESLVAEIFRLAGVPHGQIPHALHLWIGKSPVPSGTS